MGIVWFANMPGARELLSQPCGSTWYWSPMMGGWIRDGMLGLVTGTLLRSMSVSAFGSVRDDR